MEKLASRNTPTLPTRKYYLIASKASLTNPSLPNNATRTNSADRIKLQQVAERVCTQTRKTNPTHSRTVSGLGDLGLVAARDGCGGTGLVLHGHVAVLGHEHALAVAADGPLASRSRVIVHRVVVLWRTTTGTTVGDVHAKFSGGTSLVLHFKEQRLQARRAIGEGRL